MTKESKKIYEVLYLEIVTMHLKPGSVLKEIEVAERFNVSRTPIRDVFKKLEADELLTIKSQKGSYVSKIDLSDISDIMYIRTKIEYSVLSELIKVVTPGDIAEYRMVLLEQKNLLERDLSEEELADKFFILDNIFHSKMYASAGKESLLNLLNNSWPNYTRFRSLTFRRNKNRIEMLYNIHKELVDAIEAKEVAKLEDVVQRHNFSGLVGIDEVKRKHTDYFAE